MRPIQHRRMLLESCVVYVGNVQFFSVLFCVFLVTHPVLERQLLKHICETNEGALFSRLPGSHLTPGTRTPWADARELPERTDTPTFTGDHRRTHMMVSSLNVLGCYGSLEGQHCPQQWSGIAALFPVVAWSESSLARGLE